MGITDNIKKYRKEKGWSQSELAKQIGTTLSHINRIETGKYKPSLDVLMKLANVLGVSVDQLVSEQTESMSVSIDDKAFAEKIRLLNTFDEDERKAIIFIIDAVLTKKKLLNVLQEMQTK